MYYKLTVTLHYPEAVRNYEAEVRQALTPLFQNAVVINEGELNEERGAIEVHKCYHDTEPTRPCELVARFEVGRGQVFP